MLCGGYGVLCMPPWGEGDGAGGLRGIPKGSARTGKGKHKGGRESTPGGWRGPGRMLPELAAGWAGAVGACRRRLMSTMM